MISYVVPAYNEAALIARTLDSINRAARSCGEPYEIVVADDASTDATGEVAEANGARVIRVNKRQIAATRNAGARAARGDRLIFVDADTVVNEAVICAAVDAMNEGAAGGGSAMNFDGRIPQWAALLHPALVRIFRAAGLACGCFLFCTRRAYEAVGGFDEEMFASEEIWMSQGLKRQGRFVVLRESVTTSGRKLRMYTGLQVLRMFLGFLAGGRKALKKRDGLELWYSGDREDPGIAQ